MFCRLTRDVSQRGWLVRATPWLIGILRSRAPHGPAEPRGSSPISHQHHDEKIPGNYFGTICWSSPDSDQTASLPHLFPVLFDAARHDVVFSRVSVGAVALPGPKHTPEESLGTSGDGGLSGQRPMGSSWQR